MCVGQLPHVFGEARVKRLSNLLRLADAATLNDNVVKFFQLRETDQFFEKIAAQSAANTSILKSNDLFFRLGEAMRLFDQCGVNVDTAGQQQG